MKSLLAPLFAVLALSAAAAARAADIKNFDFGTFAYGTVDLKIPPGPAPNRYGFVALQYSPPKNPRPLTPRGDTLLDRTLRVFAPSVNGFTTTLDIYLTANDGSRTLINSVPLSSFSYDGQTATSISAQDFADYTSITANFALIGGERISVTPRIVFTHTQSLNTAAFNDLKALSLGLSGSNSVVAQVDAVAFSQIIPATNDLVSRYEAKTVQSTDTFELSFFSGSQVLYLHLMDGSTDFGTVVVLLKTRCSIFAPSNQCSSEYRKIADTINPESTDIWKGVSLKSLLAADGAGVPRPATELTSVGAANTSTQTTCTSVLNALKGSYLGLTPNDALLATYRILQDNSDFANASVTATDCYQNLVTQWSALGMSPPNQAVAHDINAHAIQLLSSNFSAQLQSAPSNRNGEFDLLSEQFVGGAALVDLSGVADGVLVDHLQTHKFDAASLTTLLKGAWQINKACWVDATARDNSMSADYFARGFINASVVVNNNLVADPRVLYAEIHFNNNYNTNGGPVIERLVIRPAKQEDEGNLGVCAGQFVLNPTPTQSPFAVVAQPAPAPPTKS